MVVMFDGRVAVELARQDRPLRGQANVAKRHEDGDSEDGATVENVQPGEAASVRSEERRCIGTASQDHRSVDRRFFVANAQT
jgi:hypothetical protein